jgi:PTH1 family peptidyl-tRNA hydrolase
VQDAPGERRRFVVGLGNPGREYAASRHNVGFRVVEALRRRWQAGRGRRAFGGMVWDARPSRPQAGQRRVVLLEPQTYMNRSGSAARDMAAFYKAAPQDVLVVLDDMALPLGRLRARTGGSAGGHKGLADVLAAMGSEQVPRLRVGIGGPPPRMEAADYVLGRFAAGESEAIEAAVGAAADAVEDWVFHGLTYVMDEYNRRPEDAGREDGTDDGK